MVTASGKDALKDVVLDNGGRFAKGKIVIYVKEDHHFLKFHTFLLMQQVCVRKCDIGTEAGHELSDVFVPWVISQRIRSTQRVSRG